MAHGTLLNVMRQPGWEGSGGRGMDTCTCMAESLRCSSETISMLLISYSPRLNTKKFKNLKKFYWRLKKKRKKWQLFLYPTALCWGHGLSRGTAPLAAWTPCCKQPSQSHPEALPGVTSSVSERPLQQDGTRWLPGAASTELKEITVSCVMF